MKKKCTSRKEEKLNNINTNNILNTIHSVVTHIPRVWNVLVWNIWFETFGQTAGKNAFKENSAAKKELFFVQHKVLIEIFDWQEFNIIFKIDKANQKMTYYSKNCVLKAVPT